MTRFRLGGECFATAIAGFNGPEGFLETILDNDINYSKYSVYRVVIDSGLLRIWFIDKACSGMDEDQYELYSLSVEANTNIYFAIEDYEADGGTDNCNDSLVRARLLFVDGLYTPAQGCYFRARKYVAEQIRRPRDGWLSGEREAVNRGFLNRDFSFAYEYDDDHSAGELKIYGRARATHP